MLNLSMCLSATMIFRKSTNVADMLHGESLKNKNQLVNMKKLTVLLIICLITQVGATAQECGNQQPTTMLCGPSGDANGNGWQWWKSSDPADSNYDPNYDVCLAWTANFASGGLDVMSSPFIKFNQPTKVTQINSAKDFLPENGWVLVKRDFGCAAGGVEIPGFVLYNQERALLRAFFYVRDAKTYNSYKMQLTMPTNQASGISAFASDVTLAQDKFLNGAQNSNSELYTLHYIAPVDQFNIADNVWIVGDFEVAYDQHLYNSFTNHLIQINAVGVTQNDISATITGSSSTIECSAGDISRCDEIMLAGSASELQNDPNGSVLDKLEKGAKGIKQIAKGGAEISKFFASEAQSNVTKLTSKYSVTHGNKFLTSQTTFKVLSEASQNAEKVAKIFKNISKVTDQLPGILSGVSTVAGLLGLTDGTTEALTLSTSFTRYNLSLQGTITTSNNMGGIAFYPPGGKWNQSSFTQPYYQCPIGMGGLKNTPQLELVHSLRRVDDDYNYNVRLPYTSVKVANDLIYSHPQSGPAPTSVKVSFVVSVPGVNINAVTKEHWFNLLQYEIETNSLNIATVLNEGTQQEMVVLVSPAVDIADFKGTAINIPSIRHNSIYGTRPKIEYISVISTFENGYIQKKNYAYDVVQESNLGVFAKVDDLPPFANYDKIIFGVDDTDIVIENKSSNWNSSYEAVRSVTIKPNSHVPFGSNVTFSVLNGFPGQTSGNGLVSAVASPYNDCYNTSAQNARPAVTEEEPAVSEVTTASEVKFWPNPASDQVRLLSQFGGEVDIINSYGVPIESFKILEDQETTLDLKTFRSGIYILRIKEKDGHTTSRKLIIEH